MQSIPYCLKRIFGENRFLRKVLPTLELPQRAQYTWPPHQTWPVVPLAVRWYPPWIRVITYYHVNLIFTVTEHQHWLPAPNVSVIYSVPFSSFIPWHIFNITILTMSDGKISGLLPSSFQPIPSMHFIGIKSFFIVFFIIWFVFIVLIWV